MRYMAFVKNISVNIVREAQDLGYPETETMVARAVTAALVCEGVKIPARDVLSFPMWELVPGGFEPSDCDIDMDTGEVVLGDMVISVPRCQAQAEEYGHSYEREVSYLAVHSALHLLGYDHLDEGEEKRRMRAREDAVMDVLKIPRREE